ncbi:hypothetical protein [Streptomyces sp. NRRL S-350]|uniref:hypothetical protein n=1 Tax=Streptomyces sp. NRRL S-350 TaxID=1463902 RepID=UPI0004BEBFFE|nr:hypothetical protein [Streptomyces sp. NRRL S-350]
MKNVNKRAVGAVVAGVLLAPLAVIGAAQSASATSYGSCPYPYVCIYSNNTTSGSPAAAYKDQTGYFQYVSPRTPFSVINTRNQDSVEIQYTANGNSFTTCVSPNAQMYSSTIGSPTITGLRIDVGDSC